MIPIYAFGIADPFFGGLDEPFLKELTQNTGGYLYLPNKKFSNLSQLVNELNETLRFGYELTLAAPQSTGPLKVSITGELKSRKLRLSAPEFVFGNK